ncbi:unnamed protein product [Cuscuta campestris]|uniref:CCHC-type domain-containing protein n=1 Tax=Cuscuta campestris TaxID=132261 RepID=A0A484MSJ1_9ASTE|nr:unnamed protein product [Cuscuta campestris]
MCELDVEDELQEVIEAVEKPSRIVTVASNTYQFYASLTSSISATNIISTIEDLLVQQNLDDALEEKKPATIDDAKWALLQKKAVSAIRLAIAPEIKYNYLTESDPRKLLEKLQSVYASKSLTNILCLRWELYQLRMESGTLLQEHINIFNQLVCQLKNADEKISDQEQALLLLASLPKTYRPIVQTLLVGRTKISLDEAMAVLRENERMMSRDDLRSSDDGKALVVLGAERGRNQERKRDVPRERSKSRPSKDFSNVECYYCGERGHIQSRCEMMRDDLKAFRRAQETKGKAKKDGEGSSNVVINGDSDDGDLFLASQDDLKKGREKWVLDSAASVHICKEESSFDKLCQDGEYGHINMGGGQKMHVKGMGTVKLKLHSGVTRTFYNVRYVGTRKLCKVYRGANLVLEGKKAENNLCYVEGAWTKKCMIAKKVHFLDEVEVFGQLG